MRHFAALLIIGLLLTGCVSNQASTQVTSQAPAQATQTFRDGYYIDGRLSPSAWMLQGTKFWFYFFENTWTLMEGNTLLGSGVFIMNNDKIICFFTGWEGNNRDNFQPKYDLFELTYTLQEDILTVKCDANEWMNGKWEKAHIVYDLSKLRAKPLLGIWRGFEDGMAEILQFYDNNTGVLHIYYPETGVLFLSDTFDYNLYERRITLHHSEQHGFVIEGGKLFFTGNNYRSPPYDKIAEFYFY